ncbi:unnamed protein product, partial [Polarella glacialis]
VAHPIRAGQAADILERRLALACRPGQQAGQSQPLRRRSPLGQLCAGEEFAQAGTSWHNRLCGLKLAALQQAAPHPAWDAGSRLAEHAAAHNGRPSLLLLVGASRQFLAQPILSIPVMHHVRPAFFVFTGSQPWSKNRRSSGLSSDNNSSSRAEC